MNKPNYRIVGDNRNKIGLKIIIGLKTMRLTDLGPDFVKRNETSFEELTLYICLLLSLIAIFPLRGRIILSMWKVLF